MTSVKYPNSNALGSATLLTGPTYTYGFDSAGRPNGLTDNSAVTWVQNVVYGAANEMTSMQYWSGGGYWTETRTYNERLQMTRLRVQDNLSVWQTDIEYRYSPTANNGRIVQMKDWVTGEEVNHQYDSLQRLIKSETTGTEWGLSFGYDGWGNRTSQSVTKGSGPTSSLSFNGLTNRITTAGFGYDSNGNLSTMPGVSGLTYDVENRLLTASGEQYWYGPDNRRVWLKKSSGTEFFYFYGIGGKRMGVYRKYTYLGSPYLSLERDEVYFAGKRIKSGAQAVAEDRLGSTRKEGTTASRFYPYGEEFGTATAEDRTKFATYYRDSGTGLDYADQRYYDRLSGRLLTADPYMASAGPSEPGSWNRYSYVLGDPSNWRDPKGLMEVCPSGTHTGPDGRTCVPDGDIFPVDKPPDYYDPNDQERDGRCLVDPVDMPSWCPNYDHEAAGKPKPPIARSRIGVECDEKVIGAMMTAWNQSSAGTSGVEATFRLDGTPKAYGIVHAPYTNEQMRQTVEIASDTFALFHVHPRRGDPKPSEGDRVLSDRLYGEGRDFVMFTFSTSGLYAYDPSNKTTTLLRQGLDWLKRCD
jgi:RHS repeat-associated protein